MRKNPTKKCIDCKKTVSNQFSTRCHSCENRTRTIPTEQRFWRYVKKTPTCWLWTGTIHRRYGAFHIIKDGKFVGIKAHRYSYKIHSGEIPDGFFVLHRCDNPPCVNPAHLWVGTAFDNMRDMVNKGRCKPPITHTPVKLTTEIVKEIRKNYLKGKRQNFPKKYGVSSCTIWHIINNRSWKHIL